MARQKGLDAVQKEKVRSFVALIKKQGITVSRVILFGSYAKGKSTPDSDIDLAVISPQFGRDSMQELMLLRKLAIRIDSQLEPIPFSLSEFKDKYSSLSNEIRQYGISLD